MKKYQPMDKKELRALCEDESIYLGDIDVSCVLDMSYLFCEPYVIVWENWNGIEKWDMSGVENVEGMFEGCEYSQVEKFFEMKGIKP